MMEIKGKKNTAICYATVVEETAAEQIRRMCENLGYRVVYLKRTRIMNIKLGDLKVGEYRELTKNEIDEIMKQTEDDHGQKDKN